jgi:hypothetical protein
MEETLTRGWDDLIARDSGPLHGCLILQPLMAIVFGIRSGLWDARMGRPIFFWAMALNPAQRRPLFPQLQKDVGKLFLAACLLDVVYQVVVLGRVYPMQTLIVATVLAVAPYLLVCGLANRIARKCV